ncbi:MAG: VWA domain-containing protein [Deltaproteobacteria bacterium]|nr:VWA domain-containing protein [Deltaproteobacteria bacterium]
MQPFTQITTSDLRHALERGVTLKEFEATVLRRMKLPPAELMAASPLYLLQQTAPELTEMVQQWMDGSWRPPQGPAPNNKNPFLLAPVSPRKMDVPAYLAQFSKAGPPALIAIDASPAEVGAALQYACSLPYGLQAPVRMVHIVKEQVTAELDFHPGDFLCELAVWCLKNKIALVPLATPQRLVASEFQFLYNQMLGEAQAEFAREAHRIKNQSALERLAAGCTQQVFGAGLSLVDEREDLITRSCYLASRLLDLGTHLAATGNRHGPLLMLYKMQLSLDLPPLVNMFFSTPAAVAEMYEYHEPQHAGTFGMHILTAADDADAPEKHYFVHGAKMRTAIEKLLADRRQEKLALNEIDRLCAQVAQALRHHPHVERPAGVRGTLAMREIAQGLGLIRGAVTREALAKAAFIALPHRLRLAQSDDISLESLLKSIVSRAVYGLPLFPADEERAAENRRPMTPEELARALQGLTDAAFRQLGPDEALPANDPAFGHEAMNHPLVQQALKEAMKKGLLNDSFSDYKDLLGELEDRGLLEMADASRMTLSEQGRETLEKSLHESCKQGELTAEELAEALKNSCSMPPPPGLGGDKTMLSPQAETELIAEMMDFQHQGRSESTSLEDLYVHYTVGEKKGLEIGSEKIDYDRLKIMVHELEKNGALKVTGEKKRFTLSQLALEKLLKGLIQRHKGQVLEKRAFKKEHEIDKTDVRRYQRGDVFKSISIRHTLRRVLRKGKTFDDINYTDLRAFEKKPANQLDIAVCVDISASMKEGGKLRYAKMAVAELAKAAIDKGDRMGIIAFSNLGEVVVPLTPKLQQLMEATMTLRSEQYTNIGNGLRVARQMLQKDRNSNAKLIILITDGEPNAALSEDSRGNGYHARVAEFSRGTSMETKRAMGAQHALVEAARTRRKHMKVAVVYICPEGTVDPESERVAREIARRGGGKFHRVRALERLPLEALETVT